MDSERQVVIYDETQPAFFDGLEVVGKHERVGHAIWPLWRKLFFFAGLAVIIATFAVLTGVFGARRLHANGSSESNSSTPFNITLPLDGATSFPRNIAAVSYTSQSTNYTRLYYQDNIGQLWEAANNGSLWSSKELRIEAVNGSSLAATVSRPDYPFAISIYYLDSSHIIHDLSYDSSSSSWSAGKLSNQGYKTMPYSSMTALIHECSLCANNTVIAFQDEDGNVQIGNETESGWSLTQLDLDAVSGTGLAFQLYVEGRQNQINLYYQKANGNLSLATWMSASGENEANDWMLSFQDLHSIKEASPIAAASSFSSSSTGPNSWVEILSLSNTEIAVDTMSGGMANWLQGGALPPTSNSTSNVSYSSIALTALGNAFAVTSTPGTNDSIHSWELEDNFVDWKDMGKVDIGTVWG